MNLSTLGFIGRFLGIILLCSNILLIHYPSVAISAPFQNDTHVPAPVPVDHKPDAPISEIKPNEDVKPDVSNPSKVETGLQANQSNDSGKQKLPELAISQNDSSKTDSLQKSSSTSDQLSPHEIEVPDNLPPQVADASGSSTGDGKSESVHSPDDKTQSQEIQKKNEETQKDQQPSNDGVQPQQVDTKQESGVENGKAPNEPLSGNVQTNSSPSASPIPNSSNQQSPQKPVITEAEKPKSSTEAAADIVDKSADVLPVPSPSKPSKTEENGKTEEKSNPDHSPPVNQNEKSASELAVPDVGIDEDNYKEKADKDTGDSDAGEPGIEDDEHYSDKEVSKEKLPNVKNTPKMIPDETKPDNHHYSKIPNSGDPYYTDINEETGYFNYFITIVGFLFIGFVIVHNKKRLIALVIEGRRPGGARTRRRSSSGSNGSTGYRKLENNYD